MYIINIKKKMRKLNFKEMRNIEGGVNCFAVGFATVAAIGPFFPLALSFLSSSISDCWNS